MQLKMLVLPAPLGPMMARNSWDATSRLTPDRAATPPKLRCRSSRASSAIFMNSSADSGCDPGSLAEGTPACKPVCRSAPSPPGDSSASLLTPIGGRRKSREELTSAVHDNLKHLGLETLDVVNLRVGGLERPTPGSIAEPFTVLAELRRQGLIRHLGVSNASAEQLTEARSIAPVVCVQNNYTVATRYDRELVDRCAREGIAYTPFF